MFKNSQCSPSKILIGEPCYKRFNVSQPLQYHDGVPKDKIVCTYTFFLVKKVCILQELALDWPYIEEGW